MRSYEIPRILYNELKDGKLTVEGFPNCEAVFREDYPNTMFLVYLKGAAATVHLGDDPDFRITSSGAGSPWVRTSLELLEQSSFRDIYARALALYKETEDYTRFARFPQSKG